MSFTLSVPLTDVEELKYNRIKTMLEAEREIKPSDLDLIALLVVNLSMMEHAINDLRAHGVTIITHTAYGQVVKNNPSNEVFSKANVAVRACMEQLLMTPKSKAVVLRKEETKPEEEVDPLTEMLKARANK